MIETILFGICEAKASKYHRSHAQKALGTMCFDGVADGGNGIGVIAWGLGSQNLDATENEAEK
jgi:hypothetical protein